MTTNPTNKLRWIVSVAAGAAMLAAAAGCQNNDPKAPEVRGDAFPTPDEARPVRQLADMQAANAARADATLRAYHFDGAHLNALGEERLDLMVHNGDDLSPLVVYVDIPQDDADIARRQQSVTAYLKERGLGDDQVKIESGANPKVTTAVGPLLASQQNASQQQGAAAPATGAGGNAMPGH